jgi:hypothetical protein
MKLKEGDKVRNVLTGKYYAVKNINKEWVLLRAEDGSSQVLTGKMYLDFIYTSEEIREIPLPIIPSFPGLGEKAVEAA